MENEDLLNKCKTTTLSKEETLADGCSGELLSNGRMQEFRLR